MIIPFLLFFASVAGIIATSTLPEYSDLFLLAASTCAASVILLIGAYFRQRKSSQKWIVIDGSNVLYWKNGVPLIDTVKDVVAAASKSGAKAGVIFDANAGYVVSEKFMNDRKFAKRLNLPRNQVMVVPKGMQADPYILSAARDMGARIVTNDKYRDWTATYPEIRNPGHLIPGNYTSGKLHIDID